MTDFRKRDSIKTDSLLLLTGKEEGICNTLSCPTILLARQSLLTKKSSQNMKGDKFKRITERKRRLFGETVSVLSALTESP
jgi:hypothetical protein